MRFVPAFLAIILGAVLALLGVAQQTILKPASTITSQVQVPASARYAVLSGAALTAHPGQQQVTITGRNTVFAAYASDTDVKAWLAGDPYAEIRQGASGPQAVLRTAPVLQGVENAAVTNPASSDIWLDQQSTAQQLNWRLNLPASSSLLIASDGEAAAPATVRVTWTNQAGTPWALPLLIGGGILLLLGLALYVLTLLRLRRNMRKQSTEGTVRGRPFPVKTTAATSVTTLLALGALLTPLATTPPSASAAPTPSNSASLNSAQAQRILQQVAAVASTADRQLNAETLSSRFTGPALAARQAAYLVKTQDEDATLPQAIPTTGLITQLVLPEATASWPRVLFAVVEQTGEERPPLALTLRQTDPRSPYQVLTAVPLQPEVQLPALPATARGATRLSNTNTSGLILQPNKVATDYAALLRKSDKTLAAEFDTSATPLLEAVGPAAKRELAKQLGSTADITFSNPATPSTDTVALATTQAGALTSVYLEEDWTVKPNRKGVTVKPSGGTRILAGTKSTKKGIVATYGYQLLFAVPAANSGAKIQLVGYTQSLVAARQL